MSLKKKVNNFLRRFNVELHGTGYLQSLAKGEFSIDEFDYFKKTFSGNNITIYDVGANRGSTIAKFISIFPSAKIHAFEPYAPLCEGIKNRFPDNKNLSINNVGISQEKGDLTFYVNKSVDTNSFLPSKETGLNSDEQVKNVDTITVPVTTISDYFNEAKHNQINILKLDIQGSELKALKGAEALLKAKKVDVIFAEAYFVQQYQDQPLFYDIASYLLQFGYQLQDIYKPIYGKDKIAWCDAMFIREDL